MGSIPATWTKLDKDMVGWDFLNLNFTVSLQILQNCLYVLAVCMWVFAKLLPSQGIWSVNRPHMATVYMWDPCMLYHLTPSWRAACRSVLLVLHISTQPAVGKCRRQKSGTAIECNSYLSCLILIFRNAEIAKQRSCKTTQDWDSVGQNETLIILILGFHVSNKRFPACSFAVQPPLLRGVWGY